MRRILSALLSASLFLQPLAAAAAQPYYRVVPAVPDAAPVAPAAVARLLVVPPFQSRVSRPSAPTPAEAVATHVGGSLDDSAPFPMGAKGKVTYALHSGTLPAGLSIDPDTGAVVGSASAPGSGIVDISATDAEGNVSVSDGYAVAVVADMSATAAREVVAGAGETVSAPAPTYSNAIGQVTWSLASVTREAMAVPRTRHADAGLSPFGAVRALRALAAALAPSPAAAGTAADGIAVDPSTGVVTVSSDRPARYAVVLAATDSTGQVATSKAMSVTVSSAMAAAAPADMSTHSDMTSSSGAPTVSNASGAVAWSPADALPTGMSVAPSTGVVTTASVAAGSYPLSLVATDAQGNRASTGTFTVSVLAPLSATAPAGIVAHADQRRSTAYPAAPNGVPPLSWSVASGALPQGVSLDPGTGAVTAYKAAPGTSTLRLTVTDATGAAAATGNLAVNVVPPMAASAPAYFGVHSSGPATSATPVSSGVYGTPSWSAAPGSLPAGLVVDPASGTLTATAVASGAYQVPLSLSDDTGQSVQAGTVAVSVQGPLTVSTPQGLGVHSDQSAAVAAPAAAGANGPVSWSVASGSLGPGMALDVSTGIVRVSYAQPGTYAFSLAATDQGGASARTGMIQVTVAAPLSASVPALSMHSDQTATVRATAAPAFGDLSWSVASGLLPSGVALDPATGVVTGSTPLAGYGAYTLAATDGTGETATTDPSSATVRAPLAASQPGDMSVHSDQPAKSTAPSVQNAVGAVVWSFSSAAPAGVTLDPASGVVTATNVATGSYAISLAVTDATGESTAAKPFTLASKGVLTALAPPDFATHSDLVATSGPASTQNANGFVSWSVSKGTLPQGMAFNLGSGSVTSNRSPVGTYAFTLLATDAGGATAATQPFTVSIYGPLSVSAPPDATFRPNLVQSASAPVPTNAVGQVTYVLASGTLPVGMTLNGATGVVSGDHVTNGSWTYTLAAMDSTGETAGTDPFTIAVGDVLAVSTPPGIATRSGSFASTAAPTVTGASGAVSWSVASGTAPAGLSLDARTGILTADHAAQGTYAFVLAAADQAGGRATTGSVTVVVNGPFSVRAAPDTLAHAGTQSTTGVPTAINAIGSLAWTLASGTLPAGASVSSSTGVVTIPAGATPGDFAYALAAVDADGASATTGTSTIHVGPALAAAAPPALATHSDMVASTASPVTSNAAGQVTWTLASGTLPQGVSLDPATGIVTASFAPPGTYQVGLAGTDVAGGSVTVSPVGITVVPPLSVATPPVAVAKAGQAGATAAPAVSNAVGTVSWSVASGSLPPGLSLDQGTGIVTSAPSVPVGNYGFTLRATDATGETAATGVVRLTVTGGLAVTTPAAIVAHTDQAMSTAAPQVTGATGAVTWKAANGTLPACLSLDPATGVVTARNAPAGSYPVSLVATDANGATATTGMFLVTVIPPFTARQPAAVSVHSDQVASSSGPSSSYATTRPTWSTTATLPQGMTLAAATGVVTVANVAPGAYSVPLAGRDGTGETASAGSLSVTVSPPLSVTTPPAASARADAASSTAAPAVSNAIGQVAWAVAAGTMPSGMSLDPRTGVLTSNGVAPGTYALTLSASDATGETARTGTVTVNILSTLSVSTPAGTTIHSDQSARLAAPAVVGANGAVAWASATGALAPGLAVDPATGEVTASHVEPGSYAVVLQATDAAGSTATSQPIDVEVLPPLLATAPASATLHSDQAFPALFPSVTNAFGAVSWSVAFGVLPSGATLATNGAVSLATVGPGTYSFALSATDATGEAATTATVAVTSVAPLSATAPGDVTVHADGTSTGTAPTVGNTVGAVAWTPSAPLPAGVSVDAATGAVTAARATPAPRRSRPRRAPRRARPRRPPRRPSPSCPRSRCRRRPRSSCTPTHPPRRPRPRPRARRARFRGPSRAGPCRTARPSPPTRAPCRSPRRRPGPTP